MDQAYKPSRERDRLLASAAPLLQVFPGKMWIVHLIVVKPDGKIDKPLAPGFNSKNPDCRLTLPDAIDEALRYPPGEAGVSFVVPDGMISLDLDNCIGENGEVVAEIAALIEQFDSFGYTTVSGTGLRVVCLNDAANPIPAGKPAGHTPGGQKVEIFIGQTNHYNTFSPSTNGKPIAMRAAVVRELLDVIGRSTRAKGTKGRAGSNLGAFSVTSDLGKRAKDQDALFEALMSLPADIGDREEWVRIGEAFYAGCEGSDEGREVWLARAVAYTSSLQEAEKMWDSFEKSPPHTIGAGTVFNLAKQHGWKFPEEKLELDEETETSDEAEAVEVKGETEVLPPKFSEAALARRFAKRHRKHLRYVAEWGHWYWWTGAVWLKDRTHEALDAARRICEEQAAVCTKVSTARSLTKASTARGVLVFAAAMTEMAATPDQWDADPWLLNTPGGVVDLRTGQMRKHRAQDYMRKITAVTPDAACPCPRWLQFLDEIMAKDDDLISYLQRECGYSLTGDVSEEVLCFGHGTGENGKSKYVELRVWIMGDYALDAPMETFTISHNDRHSTELARLQGARLVVSSEVEEGRHWAENRIKMLTGNKQVTARFMRQDDVTFDRQCKVFIVGNHKPRLRNVDPAIRRRLHLIPFAVQIPKAQQDKKLPEKLQAEGPGILAWMIKGAVLWREHGLQPPKAVVTATEDYLGTEDTLGRWLEECCELGGGLSESTRELHRSYAQWLQQAGEKPPTQKWLVGALTDRGFKKQEWINHHEPRKIEGLRLTEEEPDVKDDEL